MAQISADFLLQQTQQKKIRQSDTFNIRNSKFSPIISESHQCAPPRIHTAIYTATPLSNVVQNKIKISFDK